MDVGQEKIDMNQATPLRRKRICFVTATPMTINAFMLAHIDALRSEHDVTVVCNGIESELKLAPGCPVAFTAAPIERRIALHRDVYALLYLWCFFRREKFDAVHSVTPKAGLLAMLAANWAGVPVRIHTFTGQVWAVKKGVGRMLLCRLDKLLAANATHVLADSGSQRRFLIENKVVDEDAIAVLADGSIAGVDLERFQIDSAMRQQLRAEMGIPYEAVAFLFLGRLSRDKGLPDLTAAFVAAATQDRNIHLVVVGPDEGGFENSLAELARQFPGRVHRAGFSPAPEHFLSAADVFCNPSYREGFGTVLIEAGAVGLPVLASRIYGITDAVEDGVTGILHTPACPTEIADAMLLLAANRALREQTGHAARNRVMEKFSAVRVTEAFAAFHRSVLAADEHQ